MAIKHLLAGTAAVALISLSTAAVAQTTTETTASTSTASDGTVTKKVTHVRKHRTHHARRILGVKVGTKTKVDKTVKETKMGPNGTSTTVKSTTN